MATNFESTARQEQARSAGSDVCALKAQAARLEEELAQRDRQLAACQGMLAEVAHDKAALSLRAQALQEDLTRVMANHARDEAAAAEAAARALRSDPRPAGRESALSPPPLPLAPPSLMPVMALGLDCLSAPGRWLWARVPSGSCTRTLDK